MAHPHQVLRVTASTRSQCTLKESGGQKDMFPHKTADLFLTSLQRATSKLYDKRDLRAAQPARLEGSESKTSGELRTLRDGRGRAC